MDADMNRLGKYVTKCGVLSASDTRHPTDMHHMVTAQHLATITDYLVRSEEQSSKEHN